LIENIKFIFKSLVYLYPALHQQDDSLYKFLTSWEPNSLAIARPWYDCITSILSKA